MNTPQPRPALRRATDADIHPALAAVPSQETPALRPRVLGGVEPAPPEPAPEKKAKKPKAKKPKKDEPKFLGAGRATSDSMRSAKRVDLGVKVPKALRKELRSVAAASGSTTDALVTEVLNAWLGDPSRW